MPKDEAVIDLWFGTTERRVADVLTAAAREVAAPPRQGIGETISALASELEKLRWVSQGQADAVSDNTEAVIENTVAHATSGQQSAASRVGSIARAIFGTGLGLSPLITGLVRLFGGGRAETPPPLTPYVPPPSIAFEGAITRAVASEVPGMRAAPAWPADMETAWLRGAEGFKPTPGPDVRGRPVNVSVQVQAIDSRSFLDHSDEIALAVRKAMLMSHSLNDVVGEL